MSSGIGEHDAKTLVDRIKTHVGISVFVDLGEPEAVPRSEGKASRVVDNRNTKAKEQTS